MSTLSLPSYNLPTPSYTAEPGDEEQRLINNRRPGARRPNPSPPADFVKQSKTGGISLKLSGQSDPTSTEGPTYGRGAAVEGMVLLSKLDGVSKVKVTMEGTLFLKEFAEGGTASTQVCLTKEVLWSKGSSDSDCPPELPFSLILPPRFSDETGTYPLPPTYEVHLSGVPGFRAKIQYSVTSTVKHKITVLGNRASVSSVFTYYPRSCPPAPTPSPLLTLVDGTGDMHSSPGWDVFPSTLNNRAGGKDIICKLYLPHGRIFSMASPIPFMVHFSSSAQSLAAFIPLAPSSVNPLAKQHTRLQVVRQVSCDVRNVTGWATHKAKTDLWKTDTLGEGTFRRMGDGPDWCAWEGQIVIDKNVTISGFKAGGLWVKDCILLTVSPPDIHSSPLDYLRHIVPIRLTTDSNGTYPQEGDWSSPPTPPET